MAQKLTAKQFSETYAESWSVNEATIRCGISPTDELPTGGYYVYALCDPTGDDVFYVGKGKGNRARHHIAKVRSGAFPDNQDKCDRIAVLLRSGIVPDIYILWAGENESEAYRVEKQVISAIGIRNLTNISHGTSSSKEVAYRRAIWLIGLMKPIESFYMEPHRGLADLVFWTEHKGRLQRLANECR